MKDAKIEFQPPEYSLVIRTCNPDMTSHNGFKWASEQGAHVVCEDWNSRAQCGNGLHGLLWGDGDWSLLDKDIWQLVWVKTSEIVKIDEQKIKFPQCWIVYVGNMAEAMTRILTHQWRIDELIKTAEKKSSGDSSKSASSGNSSKSASSGNYSKSASSGNYSTSASSGNYSKSASSGKNTISMAAGTGCVVRAGKQGCFASAWWDGKRYRAVAANVGENGIKPDTDYSLNSKGEWEEV